ncbi:hypothetical protein C7446_1865 [Kushneria sinocarnis]|uniref:Uncharacterized protein n=1 Tax=Kushneria sinocarnis TaxID=595502 RepID=A0A420WW56_9GAMM|nr:hypothetical protein [Kushneria sinocarnis]RKR03344.1 hypothetical protein C7446_1865 [Kushneria sinocarnis]
MNDSSEAREIKWEAPGHEGVREHYNDLWFLKQKPQAGSIITARYAGASVRLEVLERPEADTSIARVIGIRPDDDTPRDHHKGLAVGERVRVPDSHRAFVRYSEDD